MEWTPFGKETNKPNHYKAIMLKEVRVCWILYFQTYIFIWGLWVVVNLKVYTKMHMLKYVGLCVETMLTKSTVIINIISGPYDHLMRKIIFSFTMNKYVYKLQSYEESGYGHNLDFANHHTLIACFMSYEKHVRR